MLLLALCRLASVRFRQRLHEEATFIAGQLAVNGEAVAPQM
jgi:hypothetical protein